MRIYLMMLCGIFSSCVILPVPSRSHIAPALSGRVIDAGTNKPIEGASVLHRFDDDIVRNGATSSDGLFRIGRLSQRHWGSLIGPLSYPLPYWKVMPGQPTETTIQVSHPAYQTLFQKKSWSIRNSSSDDDSYVFRLNK